jgi:hypothetical protein
MAMLIWVWDRVLMSGVIPQRWSQRFFSSLFASLLPNNHPSSESTNGVSLEIVHSSFHQPPASSSSSSTSPCEGADEETSDSDQSAF